MGVRTGYISLNKVDLLDNTADVNSPIISYRVPRSEVYLFRDDKPFNLFIPTSEDFTHGGTGEEDFSLTYDIIDSASLGDDLTAKAVVTSSGDVLSITAIDYDADEVTVDHDTNEGITIYYLTSQGNVEIAIVAPFASGNLRKIVYNSSMRKLHGVDQFSKESRLTFDNSVIAPETYKIQVFLNAPYVVDFDGDIGNINIPFTSRSRDVFPPDLEDEVVEQFTTT